VLTFDTEPDNVNVLLPDPLTETLPPLVAVRIPAEAVKVTVRGSSSKSAKLAALRSIFPETSSTTEPFDGTPLKVGASFLIDWTVTETESEAVPPFPSLTLILNVKTSLAAFTARDGAVNVVLEEFLLNNVTVVPPVCDQV
jgi:hypothetical protein